jgi:hypothetical protein
MITEWFGWIEKMNKQVSFVVNMHEWIQVNSEWPWLALYLYEYDYKEWNITP